MRYSLSSSLKGSLKDGLNGCLLALLVISPIFGCAKGGQTGPGEDPEIDLAASTEMDLSMRLDVDLRQSSEDLSSSRDLAMSMDLAMPNDLATPMDLSMPADLKPITGCSLVPQGGCPAGQKCTTHDGTTTICDPNGMSMRGAACTTMGDVDSCLASNICIDEGMMQTQCRAFCNTDAQCGPNSYCDLVLGGGATFKLCTQACTNATYPGTMGGCRAGLSCRIFGQERHDCGAAGGGGNGAACTSAFGCQAGLTCINSKCRRVCKKGDNTACNGLASYSCVGGITSGGYTWATYGVCCFLGIC